MNISPIRSDAELVQVHLRLDELIAANAYDSPNQELRDEFEVLTALIYYLLLRSRRLVRLV